MQRIHAIRDLVLETTKLNDLVSFDFILSKLGCSKYEAETALERAKQLIQRLERLSYLEDLGTSIILP